jgi:hypothetical protein
MTFEHPRVDIIVLNWNGREDTLRCLSSLRKIEDTPVHVIVVDNASTDDSVPVMRSSFPGTDWLTILENRENLGYTGGNNAGIRLAMERGADYLWLLNNDTTVEPDSLARLIRTAQVYPKAGLIGPKILQMEDPSRAYAMAGRLNLWFPWPNRMEGEPSGLVTGDPFEVDFLSGAAILIRREFVEKVGLLDDRFFFYWEENDWCERGRKIGYVSLLVPDAVVYHKGGGTSGKGWNEFTAYYLVRNWIFFMRKHGRPRHWITFLPFLTLSLMYWGLKALAQGRMRVMRAYLSAVAWNLRTPV